MKISQKRYKVERKMITTGRNEIMVYQTRICAAEMAVRYAALSAC